MSIKTQQEPWYADEGVLHKAIEKSIGGYKGTIEKRWHITPLSSISIESPECADRAEANLPLRIKKVKSAGLPPPKNGILKKRIRRLLDISIEDDDVGSIAFMTDFSHATFDIEDAKGQIFEFDMIFNEGCADANSGFYAVVWERSTGDEVAVCTTIDSMQTKIDWLKESLVDSFEPHSGLCPPTTDKLLENDYDKDSEHREFFDSSMIIDGLHCTYDDDKNQLELLIAVAAKLAINNYDIYYPKIVPSHILQKAIASYAEVELQSSIPREALTLIFGYLPLVFFLDDDSHLSRRGMKRQLDAEE